VYSTAARAQEDLQESRSGRRGRAILVAEGKRYAVAPGGATIGRSRDCDIVLNDSNVSRRHAELGPLGDGWSVTDLGSATRRRPGPRLRLAQRRARQRPRRPPKRTPAARAGRPPPRRHRRRHLRGRLMLASVTEPISVGLQAGFIAVLYLFLLWVSRSALKD